MCYVKAIRNYKGKGNPVESCKMCFDPIIGGGVMNWSLAKYGINEGDVKEYARRVEKLEKDVATRGKVYQETIDEIRESSNVLYRRLVERGVIDAPKAEFWTLEQLRRAYIDAGDRGGKAESTLRNQTNSLKKIEEYFGDITLDGLDADAARAYADALDERVDDGAISGATRAGYIRDAKSAFNWAVENRVVGSNPFDGIPKGSFRNEARKVYIDEERTRAVLEACWNSDHPLEWRALFTLARFQGLRIASETRALKWSDVDFDRRQMIITSQKTKKYAGKSTRLMPIFAPTLSDLQELRETQPKKQIFVFSDLLPQMRKEGNLRTGFLRILNRAGLEPWTRLFSNLRASAATDVADRYGATTESRWIGHSEKVADEHYLQILPSTQNDAGGLFGDWSL